jgi:hypothetical protein
MALSDLAFSQVYASPLSAVTEQHLGGLWATVTQASVCVCVCVCVRVCTAATKQHLGGLGNCDAGKCVCTCVRVCVRVCVLQPQSSTWVVCGQL